jgi:hypothetical protein
MNIYLEDIFNNITYNLYIYIATKILIYITFATTNIDLYSIYG